MNNKFNLIIGYFLIVNFLLTKFLILNFDHLINLNFCIKNIFGDLKIKKNIFLFLTFFI